ncbi:hypothetical protein K3495_g135 [Podosphaera aphanis]|nr:hypothetical protein K3495_g135 [Podosphaera aphanis]
MLLPKLSPLQSRLVASILASITLLLLYYFSSTPIFAYAADVPLKRFTEDHHGTTGSEVAIAVGGIELGQVRHEAELTGRDGDLSERQAPGIIALSNNAMIPIDVAKGQLISFIFTETVRGIEGAATLPIPPMQPSQINFFGADGQRGAARDAAGRAGAAADAHDGRTPLRHVYVTVTTCQQPQPMASNTAVPQLQLFVSQSPDNMFPGPSQNENLQEMVELRGGYALLTLTTTDDVYIGVYARNESTYAGAYHAQVAASIDAPYHSSEEGSNSSLFVADRDSSSALLYTDPFMMDATNETVLDEWMSAPPPFTIFVIETPDLLQTGIHNSFCGLKNHVSSTGAQSKVKDKIRNVVTGITRYGHSNLPRQQFFIDGLNRHQTYTVVLAINGNPTDTVSQAVVAGGGRVFTPIRFSTLADENCKVIYNLSFCDQVAYSVPWNPNKFPELSSLAAFYDNGSRAIYENFEKVLAQIPCETTPSSQYSLVRTCDDCAQAYKAWLCAVNIPRCTDIAADMPWLQPRAIEQAFPNGSVVPSADLGFPSASTAEKYSRNTNIDLFVSPGPYKEVLPCQELCHSLVASCPAVLGFNCPRVGQIGFNTSYSQMPVGWTDDQGRNSNITCNFPGMMYFSGARPRAFSWTGSVAAATMTILTISVA